MVVQWDMLVPDAQNLLCLMHGSVLWVVAPQYCVPTNKNIYCTYIHINEGNNLPLQLSLWDLKQRETGLLLSWTIGLFLVRIVRVKSVTGWWFLNCVLAYKELAYRSDYLKFLKLFGTLTLSCDNTQEELLLS